MRSDKIHIITLDRFFPDGGAGGGGAVQSCNKVLFGESLDGIPLKYSFYDDNEYTRDRTNDLWDLFGAVAFAMEKTEDDVSSAYVTHDYGTAFGLFLLGKNYALVYHLQGSRVEEKLNSGERFSKFSEKIIQYCEKLALAGAQMVCFPSDGAYNYFCNSRYKTIETSEFERGRTLYNTLYAFPEPVKIDGIERISDCITFLSIGQLTRAKGMDRHAGFFSALLAKADGHKRFRYIFVGSGVLEGPIISALDRLKLRYPNFSYNHIPHCSYAEIRYLQSISDVYLMRHRISIFDPSALEAMKSGKAIILSSVGGNPEFNRENNIILCDDPTQAADRFLSADLTTLGAHNRQVYQTYFSDVVYKDAYLQLFKRLLAISHENINE